MLRGLLWVLKAASRSTLLTSGSEGPERRRLCRGPGCVQARVPAAPAQGCPEHPGQGSGLRGLTCSTPVGKSQGSLTALE